jgi:hypothetical protein
MDAFEYPLGVLLFNRPHLVKHVFKSLKNSRLPLDEKRMVFHIDGFYGSKNEENFETDLTRKTQRLVESYFPGAHVIRQDSNVGIARAFYNVMDYVFANFDSKFAVFQEEDVFLRCDYFSNMSKFLKHVSPIEKIGAVSINNFDHYDVTRSEIVCPTFGTREFALRRSAFIQSQEMYQVYLGSLGPKYREKNIINVNRALSPFKIQIPTPFQDVFQHEMLRAQGKLHLRLNIPGRFDANFANGESITGFSVLQIVAMLLNKGNRRPAISSRFDFEIATEDLDLEKLSQLENHFWNQRIFSDEKIVNNLREEKLIKIRNFSKVSVIRNILEGHYLSKILNL